MVGAQLDVLQRRIGYQFESEARLEQALTHKSFSKDNNERLEFIGDAVLGYLVGVMLFRRDAALAEDALSLMRASLVRGSTLATIARELDLSTYLRMGSGERKSGGRQRNSILADAFEALIGAVHEDGGIEACRDVVDRIFAERVLALEPEDLKDAKTKLQERLQAVPMKLPEYQIESSSGADHQRQFTVACVVQDPSLTTTLKTTATASSRRDAEQAAAADMLQTLLAHNFD